MNGAMRAFVVLALVFEVTLGAALFTQGTWQTTWVVSAVFAGTAAMLFFVGGLVTPKGAR